jgi:hypothetical protein
MGRVSSLSEGEFLLYSTFPMSTPFQMAFDEVKALGLVLHQGRGEYCVNFLHGTRATEYITDDLQDALSQARLMALLPAPAAPEPPLGPTGSRSASRRGFIYRHNRKIAARRKRQ